MGSGYAKVREIIEKVIQEDESLRKWFNVEAHQVKKVDGWIAIHAEMVNVNLVVRKKVKNELNILHVAQHQLNSKNKKVKVKNLG